MCGSSGTNTVSTSSQPPQQYQTALQNTLPQVQQIASTPYQQYSGQLVAGLSPDQNAGISAVEGAQGVANPYINAASTYFGNATQPLWSSVQQFSPSAISQYESPYTSQVVNATEQQLQNLNQQQATQLTGNAVSQGAYGGDRAAVAQSVLAGQQDAQEAPTIANLENTGYQSALGEFNTQQQSQLGANEANAWLNSQAAFGQSALGTEAQNTALTGANALLGTGSLEQQQAQQELNVPAEQYYAAEANPFQTASWLTGEEGNLAASAGGTGTTSYPGASIGSQILGTGLAGAGIGQMTGAFGSSGYLSSALSGLSGASDVGTGSILASDLADSSAIGAEGLGDVTAGALLVARGGAIPGRAEGGQIVRFPGRWHSGFALNDNSAPRMPMRAAGGSTLSSSELASLNAFMSDPSAGRPTFTPPSSSAPSSSAPSSSAPSSSAPSSSTPSPNTPTTVTTPTTTVTTPMHGNSPTPQIAYNPAPLGMGGLGAGSGLSAADQFYFANNASGISNAMPTGPSLNYSALSAGLTPATAASTDPAVVTPILGGQGSSSASQGAGGSGGHGQSNAAADAAAAAGSMGGMGGTGMAGAGVGPNGGGPGTSAPGPSGPSPSGPGTRRGGMVRRDDGGSLPAEITDPSDYRYYGQHPFMSERPAMPLPAGVPASWLTRGVPTDDGGADTVPAVPAARNIDAPDSSPEARDVGTSFMPGARAAGPPMSRGAGYGPPNGRGGPPPPPSPSPPATLEPKAAADPASTSTLLSPSGKSNADWGKALLYAGLGIMSGKSSQFGANVGQGALEGLKQYGVEHARDVEQDSTNAYRQATTAEAQQRDKAEADYRQQQLKQQGTYQAGELSLRQQQLAQEASNQQAELGLRRDALNLGKYTWQPVTQQDPTDPSKTISGYMRLSNRGDEQPQFYPTMTDPNKGTGAGGTLGSREAVYFQRMVGAANSAATGAQNIMEMPVDNSSTGWFGGSDQGHGLVDAVKSHLANAVTSQDVQSYKTMLLGLSRNLAAIEANGLAPSGSLTKQMDGLALETGDSQLTKMRKMSELRQLVETQMEPFLANPRIPDQQKQEVTSIIKKMQTAIPFTQHDLTQWQKDPNDESFNDFTARNKLNGSGGGQSQQASTPTPNAAAIAFLKANPNAAPDFIKKYGANAYTSAIGAQ